MTKATSYSGSRATIDHRKPDAKYFFDDENGRDRRVIVLQNVDQLMIDGDALTKGLQEALGAKRPSADAQNERPRKKVAINDPGSSSTSESSYATSKPPSTRSSLMSIEFKRVDHLVGLGTTSCRFHTSNRLVVDGTDVSEVLMKGQDEIKDVSDRLSINFIYDGDFLKKHLQPKTSTLILKTTTPRVTPKEQVLLCDCAEFASKNSFSETKKHGKNRAKGGYIISTFLRQYTERPWLWSQPTSFPPPPPLLKQNEDTYTQGMIKSIIFSIVEDLNVVDHW
ncbi:MAG: hypothetical protein J3Q66DRAFT_402489 [Benniella sp.]|nr:MAG: hypothetical protein J3Q66DRAFT_402489 [Benniella sp.]